METLYVIGRKDGIFLPRVRISPDPAMEADEQAYAVLKSEKVAPIIECLDSDERLKRGGPGKYGTSPHVLVHRLISAATFGGMDGVDLSLEVRDLDLPGSTLTIVRRATPTRPQA